MKLNDDDACSFCGKRRSEVRKLIAGPTAFICDGCVFLSYNIIEAEEGDSWSRDFAATFDRELEGLKRKEGR